MHQGLGQTPCPQQALMDSEHCGNRSITTSEQKNACQDECSVKDTSCICFLTTDRLSFCLKAVRHFPHNNLFSFESYKHFTVGTVGPSYCLTGGHPGRISPSISPVLFFHILLNFTLQTRGSICLSGSFTDGSLKTGVNAF